MQVAVGLRTRTFELCVNARRSTQEPYARWREEHTGHEPDVTRNYKNNWTSKQYRNAGNTDPDILRVGSREGSPE